MCLATIAYVYAAYVVRVTIFSKFQPVSNFTELHALTLATRCYVLLVDHIALHKEFAILTQQVLQCNA